MAQTNLSSDNFCGYNQSASPFFWVLESGQYENTFSFGEVGINAAGGTGGSYVRPDVVDVDSFLSGRDDMLSKCQPPIPSLDDIKSEKLHQQKDSNLVDLLPLYTREKKSAVDLSSVDYNRWTPQDINPQDVRFVLEDMWAQRGGLDTQNYYKLGWKKESPGVSGNTLQYNKDACKTLLDPARACGSDCEDISGYPGKDWITGEKKSSVYKDYSKPPNEPQYPFRGPYSQDLFSVGASNGGPNFYYGDNYSQGSVPPYTINMLKDTALSTSEFPLKL